MAYHGTAITRAFRILAEGFHRPASPDEVAHGHARSQTKQSIYVSAAVEYAGHLVYAEFADTAPNHWVQTVLQLRARPGAYVKCRGTFAGKHWPRELRFGRNFNSLDDLAWFLVDPSELLVTGILMREFGPNVDTDRIMWRLCFTCHPWNE